MWDADLGDTTSKADIWALACTIVEMGTGHVYPEQQSTDSMIMNRLLGKQRGPDIPSSFPSDLQRLLQRCFAFNPKERPSAKEVLQVSNGASLTILPVQLLQKNCYHFLTAMSPVCPQTACAHAL